LLIVLVVPGSWRRPADYFDFVNGFITEPWFGELIMFMSLLGLWTHLAGGIPAR